MDLLDYLSEKVRTAENVSQKQQYRADLFKALVSSYPKGKHIPFREITRIMDYQSHSSFYAVLNPLLEKGEIKKHGDGSSTWFEVVVPGNTYDKERGAEDQVINKEEIMEEKQYTFKELEALAMKYNFYEAVNVADFLEWLKDNG